MTFPFSFLLFHSLICLRTRFLPYFPSRPTLPISPPALHPQSPTSRCSGSSTNLRPRPRRTQLYPLLLLHPTSGHPLTSPRPHARCHHRVPTPARGCPHTCMGLSPHLRHAGPRVPPRVPRRPHAHAGSPHAAARRHPGSARPPPGAALLCAEWGKPQGRLRFTRG